MTSTTSTVARGTAPSGIRRRLRSPWLLSGTLLIAGWWYLLAAHSDAHSAHINSLPALIGAWLLMSVVMMAPTAAPVLATLRNVVAGGPLAVWWSFLGGYLLVWAGFAMPAATLQWWLGRLDLVGESGSAGARWFGAAVLAVAGLYQFTPWKARCLTMCVSPMTFFLRFWRDGVGGGLRMGVRHGLTCVGCCWALMLLGLAGGISNALFMVLATALMVLEKLPALGARLRIPLGVALLLGALAVVALPHDNTSPHHHMSLSAKGNQ